MSRHPTPRRAHPTLFQMRRLPRPIRPDTPRRGVFIPADVLVIAVIVLIGAGVALLAAAFPRVAPPLGAGIGVMGLLYAVYNRRRTSRPPPPGHREKSTIAAAHMTFWMAFEESWWVRDCCSPESGAKTSNPPCTHHHPG